MNGARNLVILQVEFRHELEEKVIENELDPLSEDYGVNYAKCIREVEDHLKAKKGSKMVRIANPSLGNDWFNKLYALDWDSDHNVTMDKLLVLTQTKVQPER